MELRRPGDRATDHRPRVLVGAETLSLDVILALGPLRNDIFIGDGIIQIERQHIRWGGDGFVEDHLHHGGILSFHWLLNLARE